MLPNHKWIHNTAEKIIRAITLAMTVVDQRGHQEMTSNANVECCSVIPKDIGQAKYANRHERGDVHTVPPQEVIKVGRMLPYPILPYRRPVRAQCTA